MIFNFMLKTLFSHSTARRRSLAVVRSGAPRHDVARSAERTLALDPRPHSSAAARASLRFLVRSATERRTSRGEISFQLPFKRYPIKNFGSNRADKSENFPLRDVHSCLKSRIPSYLASKVRRYLRTFEGLIISYSISHCRYASQSTRFKCTATQLTCFSRAVKPL